MAAKLGSASSSSHPAQGLTRDPNRNTVETVGLRAKIPASGVSGVRPV